MARWWEQVIALGRWGWARGDASTWSLILISLQDTVGHYWSMWLIYLLSSQSPWPRRVSEGRRAARADSRVLVPSLAPPPFYLFLLFSCFFFRSIPSAENVPWGPWLLDDHVLQHHPLPLYLLAHLQPLPADGRQHEVSTFTLPPLIGSFTPHLHRLSTLLLGAIGWNVSPEHSNSSSFWNLSWGGQVRAGSPAIIQIFWEWECVAIKVFITSIYIVILPGKKYYFYNAHALLYCRGLALFCYC